MDYQQATSKAGRQTNLEQDLVQAKELLLQGEYTCVLCRGGEVFTSTLRGVSPLLEWIDGGVNLQGFCAADKAVGKAAALLFAYVGVGAVYATVMSEPAMAVLARFHIPYSYQTGTDRIINRAGTGQCPMELAVAGIDGAAEGLAAIRIARQALLEKNIEKPDGQSGI